MLRNAQQCVNSQSIVWTAPRSGAGVSGCCANQVGSDGLCDEHIDIGMNRGGALPRTYDFGQTSIVDHFQHGLVPFSGNGIEDRCVVIEDHHRLAAAFVKDAYWGFPEVSQRYGGIGQFGRSWPWAVR